MIRWMLSMYTELFAYTDESIIDLISIGLIAKLLDNNCIFFENGYCYFSSILHKSCNFS
jgi:hypothetical protein